MKSRSLARLFVVALALGMVATVGLFAVPARAAWTGGGVTLTPSKYWGGNTFVPGEQMAIVLRATAGDSVDVTIQNASGNPSSSNTGIVIANSGETTFRFTLPGSWPDGLTYEIRATDAGVTRVVPFAIQQYNDRLWTDQAAYLAGDAVTIRWSVFYEQNGTAAPNGAGALQVRDSAGASLLRPTRYDLTASQGSYSFNLNSTMATPETGTVYFWFNDTAGVRHVADTTDFGVGNLGVTVNVLQTIYAPGETVTASIRTRITGGFGNPAEPNIPVAVNVTDLTTGNVVTAYGATSLTTDATGVLNYVFQLATTPTSGDYQLTATATAHGTLSASASDTFTVQPTPYLSVQVSLDKMQYMSGDTIHATSKVVTSETLPLTYTWNVVDTVTGNTLAFLAGGATATTYDFAIPASYAGRLQIVVQVNDGNGTVAVGSVYANVAYGYLSLNLNKAEFSPGDTLIATFSLQSSVITNPTYYWQVDDGAGHTVTSGSTTTGTASFATPSPTASPSYTFIVTANQNGRSAQASQTAYQASGYFLSVTLDRQNYNPGDTMTVTYAITPRGTSALPAQYRFTVYLIGVTSNAQTTTSQTGTLTMVVPQGAPTGDEILQVYETNTGASALIVVHIGAINPLLTQVAGIPLFDILIFLLFVVLLLAVVLLWRRTGMGKALPMGETGKPTAPPPPPSGPGQQAAGPMSVACKHCGASIEITTSKRPIEVMCPSCGETQVVQ